MLKFIDLKKLGSNFKFWTVLCVFISGFFLLESIYLEMNNPLHTVILEKELFDATIPEQKTVNKSVNAGDKVKLAPLEYKKTSFVFQDNGETIVTETWMDPETLEYRTDEIVTSSGGKVEKNYTFYTKEGAKHHINIFRDESGRAVRGEEFYYSQERADTDADDLRKFETFAGRKEMYRDLSFWKDKGTVTSDGKTLRKLLCGNEKEGNTTCVYIDESTGFPVKEEAFKNGKLHSTMTYEFKYAEHDEKLFDTSGVGIKVELLDMNKSSQSLTRPVIKR